jgi:sigma-E factor negative regulatory protein RseC
MAHKDEISHSGRIIDIDQDFTTVEIIASSACSSCHAKGMCGFSEDEEKILQLPTDPYVTWQKGDDVEVYTKKSMGLKAVWIAYIVPLVVLMVLILALAPVVEKEIMRGVYALGGVALYYLVVFLIRGRLANEIVFDIRKK